MLRLQTDQKFSSEPKLSWEQNKQAKMIEKLNKKQNSHNENVYLVDTVTFAIVKKSHFDRLNEQRKLHNIKSRLNTDDLLSEFLLTKSLRIEEKLQTLGSDEQQSKERYHFPT